MKMQKDPVTPIAVVGLSFRGPGDATNTEGLLRMVAEGRESRSQIPKHKWNHEAFYHPDASRHGTVSMFLFKRRNGCEI
jgi:acyl transferase domain-containing protein